jgi:predicted RNase H-like HicB family nuclease
MLYRILRSVLGEKAGNGDLLQDQGRFGEVWDSLLEQAESWPWTLSELYDYRNLNLDVLIDSKGHKRKPAIRLFTAINQKGNLILEWHPQVNPGGDRVKGQASDFLRFSDQRQGYQPPPNRIVFIHGFAGILPCPGHESDLPTTYLIEAVHGLLGEIYRFLSLSFDVVLETELELEYKDKKAGIKKKLIRVYIIDSEEKLKRKTRQSEDEWLKNQFEKIGVSPMKFLRVFNQAGGKYLCTAKRLKEDYNAKINPGSIERIVQRLYIQHRDLYDKYCSIELNKLATTVSSRASASDPAPINRKVILERDQESGDWAVWCPELPGCASAGETCEEAMLNIKEAIELYLDRSDTAISEAPIDCRGIVA